jgi:homoserine dehydrogenase
MSHAVQIGLLGCGTVGAGVYKLLQEKAALYAHKVHMPIEIAGILVRDPQKYIQAGIPEHLLTTDPADILEHPEIQIVVEVMGGIEPAKAYILQALSSGKHVVTANKALIARHGEELFAAASEAEAALYLEAAVAGGLPIIQTIKRSLVANRVGSLYGIINGTTNYILSAMAQEKRDFKEVLAEAQALGYAEADPTDDIEGFDAVYKIAILSSLVFGHRVQVEQIHRVGIQHISKRDIEYAERFGYTIKLLAIAKQDGDHFEARVHPTMIPKEHPLASVNGVYNAIYLNGDAVGDMMFYGRGAGQMPTASAVVSDILNIVSDLENPPNSLMSCQHAHGSKDLSSNDHVVNRFFIRLLTQDKSGVLGQIGTILGNQDISIHTLEQTKDRSGEAELILITHPVSEGKLRQAVSQLRQLGTTQEIYSIIRVEDFGLRPA